jgi:chromosome segregation ATPase
MQDTVAQFQKQLAENHAQLQAARSEMFASHKEASEARRRLQEQQQQQPTKDSDVGTPRSVLPEQQQQQGQQQSELPTKDGHVGTPRSEDISERTAVPMMPVEEAMLGETMPAAEDGHADPLTQKLLLSVQKKDQTLTLVREDLDRVLVKLESKEMEVNKLRDTVEQIAPLQKLVKVL